MWKIILLVILLGIALAWFLIRPSYVTEGYGAPKEHHSLTKWGLVPLILAFLFVFFNSFTQVHAKEIGVGVSFGKPVAEYGAGVHFKPFWYSVTKINGTVYTDSYGTKGASNPALPVRLGDGNPATAAVSLRWHVNPDAVDYIYSTYRSNDPAGSLRDAVVDTQLQAVVNNVFGSFNPTSVIQDVNLKDPLQASRALNFSPDYGKMAQQINDQMVSAVKDSDGLPLVVIDKVTVAGITYSTATEARISGLVQQAAKTQQAVQLEATNTALSDANSKLKNSLTGPDGVKVLVQQCLQDLADGKITNQPGFSCWPGGSSGVVIPGNAAK
jgi:hypothetical protein